MSDVAPTRVERDSMGEMTVPADALYGASTARAVENFPIANRPLPPAVIHAFGHLKAACAQANLDLGKLDERRAKAIIAASDEVAQGKHDAHFPVDVYQTGSGTSTNMNANEVIANLANGKLGLGVGAKGEEGAVHPNDHVNMGQSSNDTFPTAMGIAYHVEACDRLVPTMRRLAQTLEQKATAWSRVVKIGRTHLMDATPIRFDQVFTGYAEQVHAALNDVQGGLLAVCGDMPIGGTAVGTGINTHHEFGTRVCTALNGRLGKSEIGRSFPFEESDCHPAAQAARDEFVRAHAGLKRAAVSLSKIANDVRHLGSGPRCGIGELVLPAIQPGSSIMPGKVNPVVCESVMQVVCRVVGNDATVTMAGMGGVGSIFELNVAMPVMIDAFLESVTLLGNSCDVCVDKLLVGLEVDEGRCRELIDRSLMLVTALNPIIGYDEAARVAKRAHAEGRTIREVMLERGDVDAATLDAALDPRSMTEPGE